MATAAGAQNDNPRQHRAPQHREGQPGQRPGRMQRMTPEQMARMSTDRMSKELGLSEKQVKKAYNVNLNYFTGIHNLMTAGMGGGMRGQGMAAPEGFGEENGMGGGFGGDREGVGMQGQRGPGRGMMPRLSQADIEKLNAEREKKLSKILSAEQMNNWRKSEAEQRRRSLERMKQMQERGRGEGRELRPGRPERPDGAPHRNHVQPAPQRQAE